MARGDSSASAGRWRDRVVPDRAGLPLVSGVVIALAHPPFDLLVPSFVALVPFILWHERLPATREGLRQARIGGFFLGLVYYTLVFYWLLVALIYYTWGAILAFLAPVVIMSGFLAVMSGAVFSVRRRLGWPVWLAFPVWWTANEWFRSSLPDVGFPWMQFGDTLSGFPWLIGAADLVGSRGLSFWLVAVNALVALLWLRVRAGRRAPIGSDGDAAAKDGTISAATGTGGSGAPAAGMRGSVAPAAIGLAVVLLLPIAYSVVRWNTLEMRPAARVGVVQPNVPEHIKIGDQRAAADLAVRSTDSLVAPWTSAAADRDLVILPETAIPLRLDPVPSARQGAWIEYEGWADALATRLGADLLYGGIGVEDLGGGESDYFNSAFATRSGEGRIGRYDKRFLVPIVERVPFVNPRLLSWIPFFGGFGVGDWAAPFPVETPAGVSRYGVMICYESIFSRLAVHYRRAGADFVVNITNDAWFGRDAWWSRSSALWQHPAHLVMRAIETRMGVARSANTGVSELVDPLGRVSSATPLFEPAAFTGEVLTTDGTTLYVRFGDLAGWLSVFAAITGIGISILRGRRDARAA